MKRFIPRTSEDAVGLIILGLIQAADLSDAQAAVVRNIFQNSGFVIEAEELLGAINGVITTNHARMLAEQNGYVITEEESIGAQ